MTDTPRSVEDVVRGSICKHPLSSVEHTVVTQIVEDLRAEGYLVPESSVVVGRHIAKFIDVGYTLHHPDACGPDLPACPIWKALKDLPACPVTYLGNYVVDLNLDGTLRVGERVAA